VDKVWVSEWTRVTAQSGSLSAISLRHTDLTSTAGADNGGWSLLASSFAATPLSSGAGVEASAGIAAARALSLRDDTPTTGVATLAPGIVPRAASSFDGEWLQFTFPSSMAVTVEGCVVAALVGVAGLGEANVNGAHIEASEDGVVFQPVATISGVPAPNGGAATITFERRRARVLRVTHPSAALAVGTLTWTLVDGSGLPPEALDVVVELRDPDDADGFVYRGDGAAMRGDDTPGNTYGGAVYGWNHDTVRLWLPSRSGSSSNGHAISAGMHGWGGAGAGVVRTTAATAEVRVRVQRTTPPAFDSGWRQVSPLASPTGTPRFLELDHGLGTLPGRVTVLARADDGELAGYVFRGAGAAQSNGPAQGAGGALGGVVYGFSSAAVRVWLPSVGATPGSGATTSGAVRVGRGWRGSADGGAALGAGLASVRVMAWRAEEVGGTAGTAPDYEATVSVTANDDGPGGAFQQLTHGLGSLPGHVQVLVKATSGDLAGFHFPALGMAQASGEPADDAYGGVVAAYSPQHVRLYAPSADSRNGRQLGAAVYIGDAWGGGGGGGGAFTPAALASAEVTVRVWRHALGAGGVAGDVVRQALRFTPVRRPPSVASAVFGLAEAELASGSWRLTATPGQPGDALTYRFVAGNDDGGFAIDADTGDMTLADGGVVNFNLQPRRRMVVEARSGALAAVGVAMFVVAGANGAPVITGGLAHEVLEGADVGTVVGQVTATDPDPADSVLFSIIGGNVGNAFRIGACDGTLRVADNGPPGGLSIATQASYALVVRVQDDATLPKSDNATVVVTLVDVNDPPSCPVAPLVRGVAEDAAAGDAVGAALVATDPDNTAEELSWSVFSGGNGLLDLHASSGQLLVSAAAVLDHETEATVQLSVLVSDPDGLSAMCAVTVNIDDANDPPQFMQASAGGGASGASGGVVAAAAAVLRVSESTPAGGVVGVIATMDEDVGDTVTVALQGTPSTVFDVASDGTVALRPGVRLDFETTPLYNLTVTLSDTGGGTTTGLVQVVVEDANDAPVVVPTALSVDENAPAASVLGSVLTWDADGDSVSVSLDVAAAAARGVTGFDVVPGADNELVTTGEVAFDFESGATSFTVPVVARDVHGATATGNVTVKVNDVNDPPRATGCGGGGGAAAAPVWRPRPSVSTVSGVVLAPHDVHNEEVPTMWEFDVSGSAPGAAARVAACAAACEGSGAGCEAWTYFHADYPLQGWRDQCYGRAGASVVPRYAQALESQVFGGEVLVTSAELTHPCVKVDMDEALPAGTAVATLTAVDDDGTAVTWSLTTATDVNHNNPHGWFQVDADTGVVSLATADTDLDAHAALRFLHVTATDATGEATDVLVVVELLPVDEAPATAGVGATLAVALPQGSEAATAVGAALRAVDAEGATVTYTLDGADAALFSIDAADGQMYVSCRVVSCRVVWVVILCFGVCVGVVCWGGVLGVWSCLGE